MLKKAIGKSFISFTAVMSAIVVSANFGPVKAEVNIETVALTGDPAPGTPLGVKFVGLETPLLDDAGQVAFEGSARDAAFTFGERGIWANAPGGSLELVAHGGTPGTPAPGTDPGVNFRNFLEGPLFNRVGEVAFHAAIQGPGVDPTNNKGIWTGAPGSLDLLARQGDPVPGTVPEVFLGFFTSPLRPVFNRVGEAAFSGGIFGPDVDSTNNGGVFLAGSVGPELVARKGGPAPGTDAGVVFDIFGFGTPTLNGAGKVAFNGFLAGPGVLFGINNRGIWAGAVGNLQLVVRGGDPAPGTNPGIAFSAVGSPVLNDAGEVAFGGNVTGPTVDSTNDQGIWAGAVGNLQLVVREGDPAPGTDPGVVFVGGAAPVLNGAGEVAFRGRLAGPGVLSGINNLGIWAGAVGNLQLVVRGGDPAPGTDDGVVFGISFGTPTLNGAGKVAFKNRIFGPGVDSTNDQGIWAGAVGNLQLVVREGDELEVAPGDFRTVKSLLSSLFTGSGNEDGRRSSFNDAGQVAFLAAFTDFSEGIFVATVVVTVTDPPPPPPLPPPSPSPSGGGGCTVGPSDGTIDPTLPLLMLISLVYLLRRRLSET